MLSIAHLPVSVPARAEILLVLNEAGSYHWSLSPRAGAVVLGIVSAVSLLGLIVTLSLRREDAA